MTTDALAMLLMFCTRPILKSPVMSTSMCRSLFSLQDTARRTASKASTGCSLEEGLKEMSMIKETAKMVPPTLFHWTVSPSTRSRAPMMFFEQEKAAPEKQ